MERQLEGGGRFEGCETVMENIFLFGLVDAVSSVVVGGREVGFELDKEAGRLSVEELSLRLRREWRIDFSKGVVILALHSQFGLLVPQIAPFS